MWIYWFNFNPKWRYSDYDIENPTIKRREGGNLWEDENNCAIFTQIYLGIVNFGNPSHVHNSFVF